MKSKTVQRFLTLTASIATLMGVQHANASLVGDEIGLQFGLVVAPTLFGDTVVTVGSGIEGQFSNPPASVSIDVHGDSFDIIWDLDPFPSVGGPTIYSLTDLDWIGVSGRVVGVVQTDSFEAASSITWTTDSIEVIIPDFANPPPSRVFSFAIQTEHTADPVPDAGASILFLSLGLLPIFGANLRKSK